MLLVTIIIGACTPKVVLTSDNYGSAMINSFEKTFSIEQFDSIAISDTIPNNLDKWQVIPLKDFEGDPFNLYLYVKKLGEEEIIYRLEKIGEDSVHITKRITIK